MAQVLFHWNCGRSGWPYRVSAPCSPVELARVKIQFCQADSRPKIFGYRVVETGSPSFEHLRVV